MSTFGDLLDSIGSGKAPSPPQKPPSRPKDADAQQSMINGKHPLRPGDLLNSSSTSGVKRKADEISSKNPTKTGNTSAASVAATNRNPATSLNAPKLNAAKSLAANAPVNDHNVSGPKQSTPSVATLAVKGPPRGSYAEMMARAKANSERSQTQVGTIRHAETKKDKLPRGTGRRRQEQDKVKPVTPRPTEKKSGKKDVGRGLTPADTAAPGSKAPTTSTKPSYTGTMGIASSRALHGSAGRSARNKSRYDEYLGTDEEDNSDYGEDDEGGYGSDESEDMEAGFDDMEVEESKALKAAKEDDARELAIETNLKREKEERRKKLAGLAAKKR